MQVEDGVECRIFHPRHVATAPHQTVDLIMDGFYAVVITAITVRNPGFVAEISVLGVRGEEIVQAIAV